MDDRKPVSEMVDELWACLHGDEGYLSDPLERELVDKGVTLITGMQKHMTPKVIKLWDRLIFWKRFII
ncbi:transposase [Candidatus Enterovibrio escicola]|uniref:Mobile element protein n=1 Tax=Candidatus Enterovibrio escicola TaxID=1927127 RepID=A0A2A5T4P8_9GAMM|nr:Mobile element protein [Candidatus Enterovibrio escacola]